MGLNQSNTLTMNNVLSNLIILISNNIEIFELDDTILEYQEIQPIEDPVFWISIGTFTCLMSGLIFADLMKTKLNKWSQLNESPLPLGNPRTISSWISFFTGLTIVFTGALSLVNFSSIKSLIFSTLISVLFGVSMWKAIKDLFLQVQNGTIKEIDKFF